MDGSHNCYCLEDKCNDEAYEEDEDDLPFSGGRVLGGSVCFIMALLLARLS